ncbi:MAG: iron chelate uptake ABC transporter family permease subunit [Flavobacteriales bacterium AspAUS03]
MFFFIFVNLGLVSVLFLLKPLNILLLSDRYAQTFGTDLTQIRLMIVLISWILMAPFTVFTDPIVFVSMLILHLSRILFRSVDHQKLFPYVLLLGIISMALCLLLVELFPDSVVPINIITTFLGTFFVIYMVLRRSKYLI